MLHLINMKDFLRNKGISVTPLRMDVLSIFFKYKNAISLSVLTEQLIDSNRITLYRTLKLFKEKGIIHEIVMNGEESKYAICQSCDTQVHEHKHVHFKCDLCKIVYCLEIENYPEIKAKGFIFNSVEIQSTGVCINCSTE